MTFNEAVKTYAEATSRDTVRDRAIIQAIHARMGPFVCGLLLVKDGERDNAIECEFMDAVAEAVAPVEVPRGVKVTQTPSGPVTHVDLDHRLKAEVREDGHTYIGDERID